MFVTTVYVLLHLISFFISDHSSEKISSITLIVTLALLYCKKGCELLTLVSHGSCFCFAEHRLQIYKNAWHACSFS